MDSTSSPMWPKEIRAYWKQLAQEQTTIQGYGEVETRGNKPGKTLSVEKPSPGGYLQRKQVLDKDPSNPWKGGAKMIKREVLAVSLVVVLAAALLASAAGCGRTPAAKETIRQIGSTTVLPLANKWREAFNVQHPDIDIAVSGGGSGTGIKALLSGTAEIADASRPMKDKEKQQAQEAGIEPVEHVVAYDGIAVIVHPSNPVSQLSVEQISDIFVGNIKSWKKVGGPDKEIVLINRDSTSGTYEAFKELVVTLHKSDKSRDYAAEALAIQSNQGVVASVKGSKGAIGYVGLGYLDESIRALKVIPMGGGEPVAASVENVQNKSYPISRALHMYTSGEPIGNLAKYLEYIKSLEGQAIVEQAGYVPIS